MTDFTRTISGFRYVDTRYGDTMQTIALRELGDASLWSTIVWFNGLLPPYITDDAGAVTTGVILSGTAIKVPAASAEVDASIAPDQVFLADCDLAKGKLQVLDGDLAIVSGRANLRQALGHRVVTNHGELIYHPEYGANLRQLVGALNGPVCELVAEEYVRDDMANETRVREVSRVTATSNGDRLLIDVEVVPISGVNINLTQEV